MSLWDKEESKSTLVSQVLTPIGKAFKEISSWVLPMRPGGAVPTVDYAEKLLERRSLQSLLPITGDDNVRNLVFMDHQDQLRVGFMLRLAGLPIVGTEVEPGIERIITLMPPETILQWGEISTDLVTPKLNEWLAATMQNCDDDLTQELNLRRAEFFRRSLDHEISMSPTLDTFPRQTYFLLSVSIPYTKDRTNINELKNFLTSVVDIRNSTAGSLMASKLGSAVVTPADIRLYYRAILNMQWSEADRMNVNPDLNLEDDLVIKGSRINFDLNSGYLGFSRPPLQDEEKGNELMVACLTNDSFPQLSYITDAANLTGRIDAREDCIPCPFYAYTTIHVLDPDDAKEALQIKLGSLSKQTMSESPWYRAMMSGLFLRRDEVQRMTQILKEGKTAIRAYSGINLYERRDRIAARVDYAIGLANRVGYKLSPERYITLPIFIASLPFCYYPEMDRPAKGLCRAKTCHSGNGSAMPMLQAEWEGTPAYEGGMLLMGRRGQLATINLFNKGCDNFNFTVVATSGAGKSFFTNEIVRDMRSRGGLVRIIDVGRSYERFCTLNGGTNLVFDPKKPFSINPFSDIEDELRLAEDLPSLQAVLRQMAFPMTPDEFIPADEVAALKNAIHDVWIARYSKQDGSHLTMEVQDVYDYLYSEYMDGRYKKVAVQLEPYAKGIYSKWFRGPCELSFKGADLAVLELEELNGDPDFQSVIMSLCIHEIASEVYLGSRSREKVLVIDEAWALLESKLTGSFIETAFRRMRKYNGSCGIITQSYNDADRSSAAKAAFENAEWRFSLMQKAESLEQAMKKNLITGGDAQLSILKSLLTNKVDGFSEILVQCKQGQGVFRLFVDKHSYFTATTFGRDVGYIDTERAKGRKLSDILDELARKAYTEINNNVGWQPQTLEELRETYSSVLSDSIAKQELAKAVKEMQAYWAMYPQEAPLSSEDAFETAE